MEPKTWRALNRDESGAEMIEYILLLAVIGLPLVGLLVWMRNEMTEWVKDLWMDMKADAGR